MPLDFGYIQDYKKDKGFGLVSRRYRNHGDNDTIFFHIRQVRVKSQDLASRIGNNFFGVGFWYATENTGKKVSELWLEAEASDIPDAQRNTLLPLIENIWKDVQKNTPPWLNEDTLKLFGDVERNRFRQERKQLLLKEEEECRAKRLVAEKTARIAEKRKLRSAAKRQAKQRAEQEQAITREEERSKREVQKRATKIKQFCSKHDLINLVHFTQVQNLCSILEKGLLGRNDLEVLDFEQKPVFNDKIRIDGHPEAISLTISFPNYRMFYRYRRSKDWVVLLVNSAVLWKLDCAFCQENAASKTVKKIPLTDRKKVSALMQMFEDYKNIKRESLGIPDNYTTNPQAEVLVFEPIPSQYIKEVHFQDESIYQKWMDAYRGNLTPGLLVCNEQFFKYRQDFEIWRSFSHIVDEPPMEQYIPD